MGARAFVWLGGALFVAALLTCAAWYLFVLGVNAPTPNSGAFFFDLALFSLFALHHSVFARDRVKRLFGSLSPQTIRSLYVYVSSALLIAVCTLWRPIGGELYRAGGALAWPFIAIQLFGVWCIARAAGRLDPLELAGIRPEPSTQQLERGGVYGWVRHPIYLGWVASVFGTPHMTGDRLAFAAISTLYLVAAVPFEERALRRTFGADYARYAQTVRWRIVPFIY